MAAAAGARRCRDPPHDRAFFGHPRGLSTLFFTEMWERFSYYGMRALLILFMTAPVAAGGLGFDTATAGAIYGLYTSMVYMTSAAGRLDRRSPDRPAARGALRRHPDRRAATSAWRFPSLTTFYLGLVLIVLGTGLLKGNVSVIVGQLYAPGRQPARRRLLDLLHGHQPRRVHRAAGLRLSRAARQLAPRLRRGRRRHGARPRSVRARRQAISATPGCTRRRRHRPTRPRAASGGRSAGAARRVAALVAVRGRRCTPALLPITADADRRRRRLSAARR